MVVCNECAYCSPTPGGSLYCALIDHFVPNLGCEHGEPINKAKTNADRIRAMSDEEMAMLFGVWVADCDNNDVPCREQCEKQPSCGAAWLAWLKEEVKDG